MKKVLITIDVEQDCPPYLTTVNGMVNGMPALLDLFAQENISATFFTTGRIAEQFPDIVHRIVNEKHELGCHGHTHSRFDQMSYEEASFEIKTAAAILRKYTSVVSFRAPYLSFPQAYLPILVDCGFQIDSSIKCNKKFDIPANIKRTPVSLPYACFRFPFYLPTFCLSNIDTEVMFMHPWEFVDMSKTGVRLHRRFNTVNNALIGLKRWILFLKEKNYAFVTMRATI